MHFLTLFFCLLASGGSMLAYSMNDYFLDKQFQCIECSCLARYKWTAFLLLL